MLQVFIIHLPEVMKTVIAPSPGESPDPKSWPSLRPVTSLPPFAKDLLGSQCSVHGLELLQVVSTRPSWMGMCWV